MTKEQTTLSKRPDTSEEGAVEEQIKPETPFDGNIVMKWAMKGNAERLTRVFEDDEDPYKGEVEELLNERDVEGKCPLDLASCLGRSEMIRELVQRGADITTSSPKGYTPLHHAAAWGKVNALKALVDCGGDIQSRTRQGERARETAARYSHVEAVDYLDWAEAKQELQGAVQNMRDVLADPEKHQGRLDKPDKQLVNSSCQEREDWLNSSSDPTTQELINQKTSFDELMAPLLAKIAEPPPEKTK